MTRQHANGYEVWRVVPGVDNVTIRFNAAFASSPWIADDAFVHANGTFTPVSGWFETAGTAPRGAVEATTPVASASDADVRPATPANQTLGLLIPSDYDGFLIVQWKEATDVTLVHSNATGLDRMAHIATGQTVGSVVNTDFSEVGARAPGAMRIEGTRTIETNAMLWGRITVTSTSESAGTVEISNATWSHVIDIGAAPRSVNASSADAASYDITQLRFTSNAPVTVHVDAYGDGQAHIVAAWIELPVGLIPQCRALALDDYRVNEGRTWFVPCER